MLVTDVVGHSLVAKDNFSNGTQCMFQFHRTQDVINGHITYIYLALNMHSSVLFHPLLFFGVGIVLVIISSLEFISAQSPQPMKGFLIRIFFSIRGLFQFLKFSVTLALSFKHPWASGETLPHPPVTNCGFKYLLFTIVVGLIGLLLFSVAVKKYKHRERDERMFQQQVVEDYAFPNYVRKFFQLFYSFMPGRTTYYSFIVTYYSSNSLLINDFHRSVACYDLQTGLAGLTRSPHTYCFLIFSCLYCGCYSSHVAIVVAMLVYFKANTC